MIVLASGHRLGSLRGPLWCQTAVRNGFGQHFFESGGDRTNTKPLDGKLAASLSGGDKRPWRLDHPLEPIGGTHHTLRVRSPDIPAGRPDVHGRWIVPRHESQDGTAGRQGREHLAGYRK